MDEPAFKHRITVSPKFRAYADKLPNDYAHSMRSVLNLLIKAADNVATGLDKTTANIRKKNNLQISVWIQAPENVLDQKASRAEMKERLEQISKMYPDKSFAKSDQYHLLYMTIAGKAPKDQKFTNFRFKQDQIPVAVCLTDPNDKSRIAKDSAGRIAKLLRNTFIFSNSEYKVALPIDLPLIKPNKN